jgi:hypothetical protein
MTVGITLMILSILAMLVTWFARLHIARSSCLQKLHPLFVTELKHDNPLTCRWVAIGNCDSLPNFVSYDDLEAAEFWTSEEASLIGRGVSPNRAVRDLAKRHGPSLIRIDLTSD